MTRRVTLAIKGMQCPNCSMILERMEDKLDGVVSVTASYRKAQLVVEFNENKITEEQIKEEVHRMGYEVTASKS